MITLLRNTYKTFLSLYATMTIEYDRRDVPSTFEHGQSSRTPPLSPTAGTTTYAARIVRVAQITRLYQRIQAISDRLAIPGEDHNLNKEAIQTPLDGLAGMEARVRIMEDRIATFAETRAAAAEHAPDEVTREMYEIAELMVRIYGIDDHLAVGHALG